MSNRALQMYSNKIRIKQCANFDYHGFVCIVRKLLYTDKKNRGSFEDVGAKDFLIYDETSRFLFKYEESSLIFH